MLSALQPPDPPLFDRRRTVTLGVRAPEGMSLEHLMDVVRERISPQLQELLPEDGEIRYSGTAEKLDQALTAAMGAVLYFRVCLYL